jgi:hypothetical protein
MINGKNPFIDIPKWFINGNQLPLEDNLDYLGAALGNNCGKMHSVARMRSCRKTFFALQSVGLCEDGLSVDASMYIWSSICKSSLLYACNCIYMNKNS